MVADVLSNKKLNPIITELFVRIRKLSTFLAFITQSYFAVPKNIKLNSKHYFVVKIPNKQELQQLHLIISQILIKDLMSLYKKCTSKPYSFLDIDATLA